MTDDEHNLEAAIELSDKADINKLAITDTDRFVEVIQYLGDNQLLDKASDHLQKSGFHQLMISVEVFRELQNFLRTGMISGSIAKSDDGNSVIMCGKGNAVC